VPANVASPAGLRLFQKPSRVLSVARLRHECEIRAIDPAELARDRSGEHLGVGELELVREAGSIVIERKPLDEALRRARLEPQAETVRVRRERGRFDDQSLALPTADR